MILRLDHVRIADLPVIKEVNADSKMTFLNPPHGCLLAGSMGGRREPEPPRPQVGIMEQFPAGQRTLSVAQLGFSGNSSPGRD